MRTISYVCDRCGKPLLSRTVTKLNLTVQRGMDSTDKKTFDFCSPCFLKMKTVWTNSLTMMDVKDDAASESVIRADPIMTEPIKMNETEKPDEEKESVPKKRGPKPKPINPEDWLNRTETASGPIRPPEKQYILKLYVEDGLTTDEIAAKLHRMTKGVNRAITAATRSGELDSLKSAFEEKKKEESSSLANMVLQSAYCAGRRSSYVVPAQTETIDDKIYDVGGIMALHNAGWPPSEIAKEKNYDEDQVRVLIERQQNK